MSSEIKNILKTCSTCKQSFPTLRKLIDHEKSHSIGQSNSETASEIIHGKSGIRWRCEYCWFSFADSKLLDDHKKQHEKFHGPYPKHPKLDVKPRKLTLIDKTSINRLWQCDQCQEIFSNKKDLIKHKKVHTKKADMDGKFESIDISTGLFKTDRSVSIGSVDISTQPSSAPMDNISSTTSADPGLSVLKEVIRVSACAPVIESPATDGPSAIAQDQSIKSTSIPLKCSPFSPMMAWTQREAIAGLSIKVGMATSDHPITQSIGTVSEQRRTLHCEYCHGSYNDMDSLKRHQRELHFSKTGQRLYFCNKCDRKKGAYARKDRKYYLDKRSLLVHLVKEHSIGDQRTSTDQGTVESDPETESVTLTSKDVDLPWVCQNCYGTFASSGVLQLHRKNMHYLNNKKPVYFCYKCERLSHTIYRKEKVYYKNERALKKHYENVHGPVDKPATSGSKDNKKPIDIELAWTVVKEEPSDQVGENSNSASSSMPADSAWMKTEINDQDNGQVSAGSDNTMNIKQEVMDD